MNPGRIFGYGVVGWCLAVFMYGIVMFTYAPYRACEGGPYCDKQKNHRTEAEFEAFKHWETLLFVSWPFGMIAALLLKKKKDQQDSETQ